MLKKTLALTAAMLISAGSVSFAANSDASQRFSDVSRNDWSYDAINILNNADIVEGYPDGTFKSKQYLTREEMAQIVARLIVKDEMEKADKATVENLQKQLDDTNMRVNRLEEKYSELLKITYSMLQQKK